MRTWFWTLLLTTVAVACAVKLQELGGNVLVFVGHTRIQVSLAFVVLAVLLSFVLLYMGLRLLVWLTEIPLRIRDWHLRRLVRRDHELLELGWTELLEGRYAKAEKDLTKVVGRSRNASQQVLAALSAARAAHAMSEFDRRDKLLEQAEAKAANDVSLSDAVAAAAADLLLDQGYAQQALDRLAPLQAKGARHLHTMRLLLRAYRQLNRHDQVFALARSLNRRSALSDVEATQLIEFSAAARIRESMDNGQWREVWKDLSISEKTLPEIALAAAVAFESIGELDEASKVLEQSLAVAFDTRILAAYARAEPSQTARRLLKAEAWLTSKPHDAELLATLGMLCLAGQIWGQAEHYLQRSLKQRDDSRVHALLGSLYDRLGRKEEAASQWRRATNVAASLPPIIQDSVLPAADTREDPDFLKAEVWDELHDFDSVPLGAGDAGTPLNASAAHASVANASAPSVTLANGYDADDEFFDSAPVAGLGQPATVTAIKRATNPDNENLPDKQN
jgi:HemY protein